MNRLFTALAALVALGVPAAAGATTPGSLPTQVRTLTSTAAVKRSCLDAGTVARKGVAVSTYKVPMAGYVTARLSGRASSDWDLVAIDKATGVRMAASQGFFSNEVVQQWTYPGQEITFVGCRRTGTAKTVRLSIDFVDVARPKPSAAKVSVLRVSATREQVDALENTDLDVTESRGPGWVDVLVVGAAQKALLDKAGLKYTVRVDDLDAFARRSLNARVRAGGPSVPSGRTAYRTYDDIQAELKKLVEDHPDVARPLKIGTTFQGRDIQGVEIAEDVKGDDGRPVYFLMGEHHAREWPSAEIAMEYAHLMAEGNDDRVKHLRAAERTTIVPVVNVDGYISSRTTAQIDPYDQVLSNFAPQYDEGCAEAGNTLSEGGGCPATLDTPSAVAPPGGILAYRRKNCDGEVPDGSFPCELQWGVDNNRNYGNLWGGPGSSQDPNDQSYHGPGPRSEPETQAVWNYVRTHQVTGLITMHTIAALVLRPPGLHDGGLSPDEKAMKALGEKMAAATGYTSQFGFELYDTAGTTEDDTYAATGGYGYTIEIGPAGGTFHGDYAKYVIEQWNKGDVKGTTGMREALLLMGESVADTGHHAVLAGSAPAGAKLTLSRDFGTVTSEFCTIGPNLLDLVEDQSREAACPQGYTDPMTIKDRLETTTVVPSSGSFEWHVNQSTRPFVGGGATIFKLADKPTREVTATGGAGTAAGSFKDVPFSIGPGEDTGIVKIDVTWATPEDYDIEVYRAKADGTPGDKIGSSGNTPGSPESVTLRDEKAAQGNYILRVKNYAAGATDWTAKIGIYPTTRTITTGHREAYTLTCEVGGKVVKTTQVTIDRGEALAIEPCSSSTPAAVEAINTGSSTPATTPAAKKKKVTKAQVRKAKKACAKAKKAARKAHGKKKGLAKYKAKRRCAKAKKLAKAYRKQHKRA